MSLNPSHWTFKDFQNIIIWRKLILWTSSGLKEEKMSWEERRKHKKWWISNILNSLMMWTQCCRCFFPFLKHQTSNSWNCTGRKRVEKWSCGGKTPSWLQHIWTWNWIIVEYLQPIFFLSGELARAAAEFNKQISDKATKWCWTTRFLEFEAPALWFLHKCVFESELHGNHYRETYTESTHGQSVNCQLAAALSNQTGTLELMWPDTCV